MRSGRLKHIVTLLRPTVTLLRGAEVKTFVKYCDERADIMPLRGQERLASMQVNAELTTKIVTRWSPTMELVESGWQIKWRNPTTKQDAVYEIDSPPINSGLSCKELIFMCKTNPATQGS